MSEDDTSNVTVLYGDFVKGFPQVTRTGYNFVGWFDDDGNEKPVELILPDDADLAAQLSTRKYGITEKSKVKIESKKDVKARGQPSPDEADCVLLLCLPVKPSKAHPPKGTGRKE